MKNKYKMQGSKLCFVNSTAKYDVLLFLIMAANNAKEKVETNFIYHRARARLQATT